MKLLQSLIKLQPVYVSVGWKSTMNQIKKIPTKVYLKSFNNDGTFTCCIDIDSNVCAKYKPEDIYLNKELK